MTRRRSFGLRPRLLAALVFTSVVTLAVAALALLPPLQSKLTDQAAQDLENATTADGPLFDRDIVTSLTRSRKAAESPEDRVSALGRDIANRAFRLNLRTDARVIVASSVPDAPPIFDTATAVSALPRNEILRAISNPVARTVRRDNQVIVVQPIDVPGDLSLNPVRGVDLSGDFVLVTLKPLTDVTTAVHQVRNAFLAAAAVGLLVAVLLGIALATTIGRRLARLRAAAVRVAEEGTDAPTPRDDGRDEVGDLARALASMQRELRRQEAARRSFVATASHELRTPLTSLQGTIELLEEDLRSDRFDQEDAWRQVVGTQRQLRRLARLASELLDLSRLDADVSLREEPVELGELCRAVAAEFELRAVEGDVELEVPAPPGPCWGRGDPSAVARVVRILLDNALRHAPESSTVRVVPAYHGENATVAVDDDGPGVGPDDRERIFERFERGSAPSGAGGFGLGLAIGRELARKMGGQLRLVDTQSGARFVLELPIELPAGSHPEPDSVPTPYMS
ncbi:MAG TPA: HAMP domain-containing sensor histidine kinase [Solirubrobacteraceae bacterium]|nr:HAMP domain-containing sensor histidine kinase [Solirubrobacteraceae bacterium]